MNEIQFKKIQREVKEADERTAKLSWELEEAVRELSELGFTSVEEAHEHLESLEQEIIRHEEILEKRQKRYERKWVDRIAEERD